MDNKCVICGIYVTDGDHHDCVRCKKESNIDTASKPDITVMALIDAQKIYQRIQIHNYEFEVKDYNQLFGALVKYYTLKSKCGDNGFSYCTVIEERLADETISQTEYRLYSELSEADKLISSLIIRKPGNDIMDESKPLLIKTWKELSKLPPSKTHKLDIDVNGCNGWLIAINVPFDTETSHYLSTHAFYKNNYKDSTKLLQQCGFNVELENWG